MKTIALVNQKGGVGKTTSTINLAGELAQRGYKVLIIDADSQGNTSSNLSVPNMETITLSNVMLGDNCIDDAIQHTGVKNVDIVASNLDLQYAEMVMQSGNNPRGMGYTRNDLIFKKSMEELKNEYDFCFVDCAPSLSTMTINVLTFVEHVLIPIKIDRNSLEGYGRLMDIVRSIKKDSNSKLSVLGAFLVAYEKGTKLDQHIYNLSKESFGELFIDSPIHKNVAVREAPLQGLPVCLYDKNSVGSKDYSKLTSIVLRRLEMAENKEEQQNG